MQFRYIALLSTAAFLTASSFTAFAQTVPSTAEPSRVPGQIAPLQAPTRVEGAESVATGGAVTAPQGAEKIKLTLKSVTVDNMTAYQPSDIEPLYRDMIGTTITLADVYGIAEKLTAKYRNEGYILTQVVVPPQTIEGGSIRLRVVEGFVDEVAIQGKTQSDIAWLAQYAENIRAAKPLNAKALERYVLLMNDLSGISARAVLSPSPKTPGASDVTLVVDQKPYDLFMQVDNRGSRYLGPLQLNAGGRLNNVFGLYEGIDFQAVTAPDGTPDRELDYAALSWIQPLNHEGTRLTVGGSVSSTEPGYTLSAFDVRGRAHTFNLELMHPFIRARNENLFTSVKFNFLNSTRNDNLGGGRTEDRLRVARLSGTYQFTDRYVGMNTGTLEVSQGLGILHASNKGDANMTRAAGNPTFFKGTLEVSRLQRLTDRFELLASASGQKSANTLLASEEFGVGGTAYGSAYDNSEITGENGLAGRLELRMNQALPLPVDQFQVYGFYDIGKVWDNDNAVVKERRRSLASSGLGFRATLNENISGSFEYAVPLTRDVEAMGDDNPRMFGTLTARF